MLNSIIMDAKIFFVIVICFKLECKDRLIMKFETITNVYSFLISAFFSLLK